MNESEKQLSVKASTSKSMKNRISLVILALTIFLLSSASSPADGITLAATIAADAPGVTNTIELKAGETAELLAASYTPLFLRDGVQHSFGGFPTAIITGPATIPFTVNPGTATFMTLRISRCATPPDKTLIIPEGTNALNVALESSTDLVNWATAANGFYGGTNTATFFRIRDGAQYSAPPSIGQASSKDITLTLSSSHASDTFEIHSNELAQVISASQFSSCQLDFQTDGQQYLLFGASGQTTTTPAPAVAGPATLVFHWSTTYTGFNKPWVTIRVTSEPMFPPERTVMIPHWSPGANVALQCSTNLVDWFSVTNGVYSGADGAKFFRINLDRAP